MSKPRPIQTYARYAGCLAIFTMGRWYRVEERDTANYLVRVITDNGGLVWKNDGVFDEVYSGYAKPDDGWSSHLAKATAIPVQQQIVVGSQVKLISIDGPSTSGGGTSHLTIGKIYEIAKHNPRTDLYLIIDDNGYSWWVNAEDIMLYGAQPMPAIARAVKNFSDTLNKRVTGNSGDAIITDDIKVVQEGQCKTLDEEVFPTYKPDVW